MIRHLRTRFFSEPELFKRNVLGMFTAMGDITS